MLPPLLIDVELAGPKVLLRPIAIADIDASYPLVHERRAVTDWLMWDGPDSREELVRRYESWAHVRGSEAHYHLAVVERGNGAFCGALGLTFDPGTLEGVIGYWLGEPYWSVGLGTEAVGLLAHLSFVHLAARSLAAFVFEGNIASERVLLKNAFQEDPRRRDLVQKGDEPRARRCFRLTSAGWSSRSGAQAPEVERVRRT